MLLAYVSTSAPTPRGRDHERSARPQEPSFAQILPQGSLYHGCQRWRRILGRQILLDRLSQVVRERHGCAFHEMSISPHGATGDIGDNAVQGAVSAEPKPPSGPPRLLATACMRESCTLSCFTMKSYDPSICPSFAFLLPVVQHSSNPNDAGRGFHSFTHNLRLS